MIDRKQERTARFNRKKKLKKFKPKKTTHRTKEFHPEHYTYLELKEHTGNGQALKDSGGIVSRAFLIIGLTKNTKKRSYD